MYSKKNLLLLLTVFFLNFSVLSAQTYPISAETSNALEGLQIMHSNGKWVRMFSPNLTAGAYNSITGASDAGIIFGSVSGGNTADFGFTIAPHRTDVSGLRITSLGKVGIGVNSPTANLHISTPGGSTPISGLNIEVGSFWTLENAMNSHFLKIWDVGSNATAFIVKGTGNVGIGTSNPNAKLTVKGMVYSEEIKVDLNVPAPDYVFEKNYDLPSLTEIEKYISENKHLPEIPSANEMEQHGIKLGEMNMLLLKKVEEITLHLIQQNLKLREVEQKSEVQAQLIDRLLSEIETLKK